MMKNILFILSLFTLTNVFAKESFDFEEKKEIRKSFFANNDFELSIINKHGDISFETWEKDSISIQVSITVQSDKLERVNDMIERIDVRFGNHSQYISATTEWGSNGGGLKADVLKLLSSQSINVDYKVFLPEGIELNIENRYGNILFEDYKGDLKIDLVHGKLYANQLKDGKVIKVSYGEVSIKEMENADIVGKFSDINIAIIKELNLDAISSEIEIEKVNSIKMNASASKVEIEEVESVDVQGSFSEIEIEKLLGTIDGELKFGSLEVDHIATSFMGIDVIGSNTDIDLDFDSQIAFHYFVELEKGKSFRIPAEGNSLDKKNEHDDFKDYEGLFATMPVGGKPARVSVQVKNSYVKFGLK